MIILMLVTKYHDSNCEDKEILVSIDKTIKSSLQLRSKKELIDNFIAIINTGTDIDNLMPPVSRFGGGRGQKKDMVIEILQKFFEKFFGLV